MTDAGLAVPASGAGGRWLRAIASQRELSLVAIMVVLGALVTLRAPQFLTMDNLSQVAVLASVTAVAAIGEAIVILTRNVDLSVEATIGIVAYVVAVTLETHTFGAPVAILLGLVLGLVLGMVNGVLVAFLRVPAIVATLGTLSVFRGIDYFIAGSHQVALAGLPDGFTDPARTNLVGIPVFVLITVAVIYSDRNGYRDVNNDGLTLLDCFYYAVVSLSTTGYGDITPITPDARLVNILVITPARVLFLIILVCTTLEVLTDQYRNSLRVSRWRRKLKDHVIVCGYGTKGRSAISALCENGIDRKRVVVV